MLKVIIIGVASVAPSYSLVLPIPFVNCNFYNVENNKNRINTKTKNKTKRKYKRKKKRKNKHKKKKQLNVNKKIIDKELKKLKKEKKLQNTFIIKQLKKYNSKQKQVKRNEFKCRVIKLRIDFINSRLKDLHTPKQDKLYQYQLKKLSLDKNMYCEEEF